MGHARFALVPSLVTDASIRFVGVPDTQGDLSTEAGTIRWRALEGFDARQAEPQAKKFEAERLGAIRFLQTGTGRRLERAHRRGGREDHFADPFTAHPRSAAHAPTSVEQCRALGPRRVTASDARMSRWS